MGLIDEILDLADEYGIDRGELVLDEAHYFLKAHEGHGSYELSVDQDEDGVVETMTLRCRNESEEDCPHHDDCELPFSFIYSNRPIRELDYQAKRRQGDASLWDTRPIPGFLSYALKNKGC